MTPAPPPTPSRFERETLDRLRRIETRFTRFMEQSGFETEVARPWWEQGRGVVVPSRAVAFNQVVAAIPSDHSGPANILMSDGECIGTITKP